MREIVCVKNNRNVDSNELRQKVEKLKPMHSIAKNFFIKCHKTNFMEEIELNSNLLMHISNHMHYRAFPVIDQWNKLPVALLDVDDTKAFENSIFGFYRNFY